MKAILLTGVLLATTTLTMTPAMSQQTLSNCDRLTTWLEQRPQNAPVTLEEARTFERDGNDGACREVLVQVSEPGDAAARTETESQVVVRQAAPSIEIDQAAPTVTLQQQQPNVSVQQGQPEIVVQQPAPTVTIDIPQPIITVRMPEPDVNVSMPRPQVDVEQPTADVQMVQPQGQPDVEVNRAQPQVRIERAADAGPNIDVQNTAEPVVRYERAEPRIVVNQPQGQPQVRMERAGEGGQDAAQMQQADGTAGAAGMRDVTASELRDATVVSAAGEQIGDVERLVRGQDDSLVAIVGHGGFLGLGEKQIAVPLENAMLRGETVVLQNMNLDQIRAMPAFNDNDAGYEDVEADFAAPMRTAAASPATAGGAMQTAAGDEQSDADRLERQRLARERVGPAEAPAAANTAETRAMEVDELQDMTLYNRQGDVLGDIERVVLNPADGRHFVVIGHGGFAGLFEDQVALPLDRIYVRDDRATIAGISDAELEQMEGWRERFGDPQVVEGQVEIDVSLR